jgi:precorrin-2 dehydrogenase/sirohydrochlorin ferrochelatase
MKYYPAFLDLRGRTCLVVGGGPVAERKTLSLLAAGAKVVVTSPSVTPGLHKLSRSNEIMLRIKEFDASDVEGCALVVAATDNRDVNTRAARECKARGILVNAAVPPEESSFIVPSVVERGALMIAVSTSGASPALAKKIRRDIEQRFGPEYGQFLALFASIRTQVQAAVPDEVTRIKIYNAIVDSDVLDLFKQGRPQEAEERMRTIAGIAE